MEEALDHAVALFVEATGHEALVVVRTREGAGGSRMATNDPAVAQLDALQLELDDGPNAAALEAEVVHARDLSAETRWPGWSSRLAGAGLLSLLCLRLPSREECSVGTACLYAPRLDAFGEAEVRFAQLVAALAATAIVAATGRSQLECALASRTTIGQATGILMERFALAPEAAFGVMCRLSQNHHLKLHSVATHLVQTGSLPHAREVPTNAYTDMAGRMPPGA